MWPGGAIPTVTSIIGWWYEHLLGGEVRGHLNRLSQLGDIILTVLNLADRSSMDPVFMDPAFTLTVWTEALVRAVLPSHP